MDLGNNVCLQRPICQCILSVYFSRIFLTISSTQAAAPSIPMQNLWPVQIREGSSTVEVLKGICYMLENRFFESFWRSDWGRCFCFFSFSISRNAYKIVLQQNSKKLTLHIFGLTARTGLNFLHFSSSSVLKHSWYPKKVSFPVWGLIKHHANHQKWTLHPPTWCPSSDWA